MNFDEIIVKESPGICRCCLSEGCYKDLGSEYTWMNETEVYADMLLDCFDIGITQHNDGPNGAKRLICEVCVTRLRDACNFKKQVVDSEKRFIDMLGRGDFRPKTIIYQTQIQLKQESVDETPEDVMAEDVEYLEDVDYDRDVDDTKPEVVPAALPSTSDARPRRGRPRKDDEKPDRKKQKLAKGEPRDGQKLVAVKPRAGSVVASKPKAGSLAASKPKPGTLVASKLKTGTLVTAKPKANNLASAKPKTCKLKSTPLLPKASSSETIDRDLAPPVSILPKKGPKRLTAKEKRNIMVRNVTQVLLKTTVMPFRWLKSSYRCFYCYEIFQESSDLKEHQIVHTGEEVVEKAMNNYWEPVVYLDISGMTCKLCPEVITDLYDMVDHLIAKHGVTFNKDIGMCMVAFKLDNLDITCLICGAAFFTFGPLLCHTNKAHKGTNVLLCELCGQHFKHTNLLRLHIKSVHENTSYPCPGCGEKFLSPAKLRTHQKTQHFVEKKYKCLVCTETFQSHYKRSRHMATEHENRKVIKCLQCPRTFIFRSMMMTHLRDTHLKVRNFMCSVCGWRAFNSNRLKNHMFKHSGEKNFKCEVCDKAFSTRKIMMAHLARMHKAPQQPAVSYGNPYGQQ